jgi:C-terminal processing protease CtpA/Prc
MPEWAGLGACLIDDRGRPVVNSVSQRIPAWREGVLLGMAVVSVNGVPAEEAMNQWIKRQRAYYGYSSERYLRYDAAHFFHRQPKRGDKVRVELEDLSGRRFAVTLSSDHRQSTLVRMCFVGTFGCPRMRCGLSHGHR